MKNFHQILKPMMELSRDSEIRKAYMRIDSFADRAKSDEKFMNMLNLRTKKMTKVDKVQIWADALEDRNLHDAAEVAYARLKELQK